MHLQRDVQPSLQGPLFVHWFTTAAMAALAALTAALCASAGTWNAYGPVTYTRGSGTPVVVTNTFNVLNPNTQYTLHVVNGGLTDSDTELVSSSVITVNGVQCAWAE